MSTYKFKGWDWSELARAWRIRVPNDEQAKAIRAKIWDCQSKADHMPKAMRQSKVYKDCRAFMRALIKDAESVGLNDYASFFRGIQGAKDPCVFLHLVSRELEHLWNFRPPYPAWGPV